MKPKRIRFACLIAVLLGCALAGQDKRPNEDANTRSVQGTVTDSSGNPVASAVVQLKDMRSLQVRSFIAQDGGLYHFTALKIDNDYQVKADFNGMTSGWRTLSVFDSRKVAVINLKTDKTEKK